MLIETVNHLCHQAAKRGGNYMQRQGNEATHADEAEVSEKNMGEEEEDSRYFLNAPEYRRTSRRHIRS
jgi:hypothetical protein